MEIRRLNSADIAEFMTLRTYALTHEPERFRVSAYDDAQMGQAFWENRLNTDRVLGIFADGQLVGVGGLSRFVGEKLRHKGLIWGMYITPTARGSAVSELLMSGLIECGKGYVTHLQLTLMADNARAQKYYERHGFKLYAIEPQSVMTPSGPADEALMWRLVE